MPSPTPAQPPVVAVVVAAMLAREVVSPAASVNWLPWARAQHRPSRLLRLRL
jgi:hypothetical protein